MNWLQKLHLIDAPEGTTLRMAELHLRGLFPWWLAAVLLLAAGVGAFYLYFRETVRMGPLRRVALALLRTGTIGLVLVLLLRPVLLAEFQGERLRSVVVLLDNTQSMNQQDRRVSERDRLRAAIALTGERGGVSPPVAAEPGSPSRLELLQGVLRGPLLDGLRDRGPLQGYLFDHRVRPVGDSPDPARLREALLAGLTAEGDRTALADSIHEILVRTGAEAPAAIVVATDGHDNASKLTLDEAARACRDRGVPLHIYGVGSSEAGVLQVLNVRMPSTLFIEEKLDAKDDLVEVPVRFRCRGFGSKPDGTNRTVVLTLTVGKQVITESFPAQDGENLERVVRFTPQKGPEGERAVRLTLEIRDVPGTLDEIRQTVQVKTSKVKVLYVENTPRREYKFVQPVLDRDRRVLARFYLVEGDPRLAESPPDVESGALFLDAFPENFPDPSSRDPDRRPFDLLILGDVPLKALGEKGVNAIQRFVKEGGGLVLIAGRNHAPAEYVGTPLAETLPVVFGREEFPLTPAASKAQPFRPVLTYDGEQAGLLSLADTPEENQRLWKEELWKYVPGFYWHYPVSDLKPGALALVAHPEKKAGKSPDEKPMPIIASQRYGKGEVLFLGVEEMWRWRDNTGDRLTARFWGQVVAQLGLPHLLGNARRTQMDIERREAVLGRPGSVKARLLDSRYEPLLLPTVKATLVHLDAPRTGERTRPVLLQRIPGQPGEYRGGLPNDVPGRFELRIAEGEGVEASVLPYRVELPPRHELERAGLDEEPLRSAARISGGAFYREEDLARLPEQVESRTLPFTQRQEILLWNALALWLFVLLITAEWVLRKFSNLS
jgi:hypothetical protein